MDRIDTQMLKIYKESTKKDSIDGKKVSPEEARDLILRAEALNQNSSGSCFRSSSRGTKNLKKLVKNHKDDFSHESRDLIKNYTKTGHLPRFDSSHSGNVGASSGVTTVNAGQPNFGPGTIPSRPNAGPQLPGAGLIIASGSVVPNRPAPMPPRNPIPAGGPVIVNPPNAGVPSSDPVVIRPPSPGLPSSCRRTSGKPGRRCYSSPSLLYP